MSRYGIVYLSRANRSFDRAWIYRIPPALQDTALPGSIVAVPFGTRKQPVNAYLTELTDTLPSHVKESDIKPISSIVSSRPQVTEEQIILAFELKRRCYCTIGEALNTMIPPDISAVGDREEQAARLTDPDEATDLLETGRLRSMKQIRVIELLLEHESASLAEIRQATGASQSVLRTLRQRGVLTFFKQTTARELDAWSEDELTSKIPTLKPEQQTALDTIVDAGENAKKGELSEFLLFGVTGSGKTEVYLRAAEQVLSLGKTVLILVPEIALTPQMMHRLVSRFGHQAAILHSRLTPTARYETWQRILEGSVPIVVGARSAVFAPLRNLGLIVVDEEQESSYKSETMLRYYACDVARMRAILNGAVLVMGSATPQISTFWRTETGKSRLLRLPNRITRQGLPDVEIVDMRREYAKGNVTLFSEPLRIALQETLERREQAILLLNRRGYSRTIICPVCGWQMRCPRCDVALATHRHPFRPDRLPQKMVCHLCDLLTQVPEKCPACGHDELMAAGAGTQQVEDAVSALLPEARLLRMDQDSTRGRFSHREILETFERREADILVGTQMIAKGHDFPNVTLSAVLSADQLLATGEFRSSEQAFQLMTQAAGRSGRGLKKGRVFIQTMQPDHFVVRTAANQDYETFYREEIVFRKRMGYLPFCHIAEAMFKSFDESAAEKMAQIFYNRVVAIIRRYGGTFAATEVTEPAPAPIAKIRHRYRFRVIVSDPSLESLSRLVFHAGDHIKRLDDVSFTIDIDSWSSL